ncbi:MAG: hypothetical protein ACOZCL_14805 [Bacillota bacterium]
MIEIFSKTIRLKNGKILYASNYGLEAFRFFVSKEEYEKYWKNKK